MRIALLTPGYSSPTDEWAIPALRSLVDSLGESHDLELFALRYPYQPGIYWSGSIRVTALGGGAATGFGRIPLLWRGWQELRAAHHKQPFDLIHGFWGDEAGFLAVQAGAQFNIPAVVSIMGGELVGFPELNYGGQLSFFNRWFSRLSILNADLVTAGSQKLHALICRAYPLARVLVFPLGVDIDRFHHQARWPNPTPQAPDRLSLLSVGSLVPVKDQTSMLQALALIQRAGPDFYLNFVGDGPLRTTLERLVDSLDLAPRVIFHGHVPYPNIRPYYLAADLFIQSSFYESQGMAVLEAAACGVPVAGTATGVLPEIVPAGWTCPVGDPQSLADVLAAVLANPEDRQRQAAKITAHVREQFGVESTARRLATVYQSLIKG